MLDYNLFKPIRNFGILILAFGSYGLFSLAGFFDNPEIYLAGKLFVLVVSLFTLFMGYNIVSRNRFGYKSLKLCLYLLYPAFPLGYFYAKKAFAYIETNHIAEFYRKSLKI